ncbi:MAG: DnaJ domain-containing protein, partial [Deltaproteobacteria bacterium]|nr:DnaJ domain-containing protein [Deltaproteobacteria bacterium]
DLLTQELAELINLDTISLLITGVNIYGNLMNLNSLVATLKDKAFYLPESEIIKSYGFNKKERTLLRKLYEGPLTLEDLRVWEDVDNEIIKRVLYVLILLKKLVLISPEKIESVKASLNLKPVVSSVPPPPVKKSFPPEIMALREEIKKRATDLPSQNYYEMLGVDMSAQSSDIRTAFFRLAKKFHPDKAGKEGLEDLRDTFGYYFTNLSEAHSTLTDFDSKELYDKNLKSGVSVATVKEQQLAETREEKEVRLTLEASVLYQKAMVQLKHNKVDEAIILAEKAYVNCPEEGEYRALVSYLKVLLNKENPANVISILREETQHNPKSENIHLFFAKVLQKADKVVEAKEQYKKVVRINPRNIEAEREIRIIDMRLRNSGKHSTKGLFGMFKK